MALSVGRRLHAQTDKVVFQSPDCRAVVNQRMVFHFNLRRGGIKAKKAINRKHIVEDGEQMHFPSLKRSR